jgi:hypothetical protein
MLVGVEEQGVDFGGLAKLDLTACYSIRECQEILATITYPERKIYISKAICLFEVI